MKALVAFFAELPGPARWALLGAGALVVGLIIAAGTWSVLQLRESAARTAFAATAVAYRQGLASRQDAGLAAAARSLNQFLREYPRSAHASEAWYLLGNVEHHRKAFDAALAAYDRAAKRGSGTIGALSRLDAGYVWEAKGDPTTALMTYRKALEGLKPQDFLYTEFLLAVARMQEELKQSEEAIKTYRRLLSDAPESARAEDVRLRLAILGAAG